jgi:hypothetical protein
MGGLNVHADDQNSVSASQKKKWNKSPKLLIGLAVLIAIPIIGTTLAGNVSINGGSSITFGQGYQAAIACDDAVTITPNAYFTSNTWTLQTITVSGLDTRLAATATDKGCQGKNITLAAFNTSGETIENTSITFSPIAVAGDLSATLNSVNNWGLGVIVHQNEVGAVEGSITITFSNLSVSDYDVQGFTIQQS